MPKNKNNKNKNKQLTYVKKTDKKPQNVTINLNAPKAPVNQKPAKAPFKKKFNNNIKLTKKNQQFGNNQQRIKNNKLLNGLTEKTRAGNARIVRKEFISTLASQATYTVSTTQCNPGTTGLFTWLPNIATSYQKYHINKIGIQYETSTGFDDAGRVWLAWYYDVTEISNTTKFNTPDAISANAGALCLDIKTERQTLWLNLARVTGMKSGSDKKPTWLIRSGTVNNDALPNYDPAFLVVATMGDTIANVGSLFIVYDITLIDAIPNPVPLSSVAQSSASANQFDICNGIKEYSANTPVTYVTVSGGVDYMTFKCDFRGIIVMFSDGVDFTSGWTLTIRAGSTGTITPIGGEGDYIEYTNSDKVLSAWFVDINENNSIDFNTPPSCTTYTSTTVVIARENPNFTNPAAGGVMSTAPTVKHFPRTNNNTNNIGRMLDQKYEQVMGNYIKHNMKSHPETVEKMHVDEKYPDFKSDTSDKKRKLKIQQS